MPLTSEFRRNISVDRPLYWKYRTSFKKVLGRLLADFTSWPPFYLTAAVEAESGGRVERPIWPN